MSSVGDEFAPSIDGNFTQLQREYIELFNVTEDWFSLLLTAASNLSLENATTTTAASNLDPFYFYEVSPQF